MIIGIDNGCSGSIGIIRKDGSYSFCKTPVKSTDNYQKPKLVTLKTKIGKKKTVEKTNKITRIDVPKLRELITKELHNDCEPIVLIERPLVNPKMFTASTSALRAFEATIIVLEDLSLAYTVCDSKEWQSCFFDSGIKGEALKTESLKIGTELFPLIESKHPDRDSLLMAEWYRIKHLELFQ